VHPAVWLLAIAIPPFSAASVSQRSTHFVVEAPTADIADRVARAAERRLKELSQQWLGHELPDWPEPCQINVTLGPGVSRGSSTFVFRDGRVTQREVHLEGTLERILDGVLPHEMSHVVLTQHFGRPFPRWADEGGATLAEGELQTAHYREQMQHLLTKPERCIPLHELFDLERYPRDSFAFYEIGFSISSYLVELKGRRKFLEFVAAGMDDDWNKAVQRYYGFDSVEDLQKAWLARLHKDTSSDSAEVARREQLPAPAPRPAVAEQSASSGASR
jgi:PAS domain-containing protein